jgi:hypothetical protein
MPTHSADLAADPRLCEPTAELTAQHTVHLAVKSSGQLFESLRFRCPKRWPCENMAILCPEAAWASQKTSLTLSFAENRTISK